MNAVKVTRGHLLKTLAISLAIFVGMGVFSSNVKAQKNADTEDVLIAFLNISNGAIMGSSTVPGFENEIEVLGLSYGITQAGEWDGGDTLNGRITFLGDLTISKYVDIASPHLAQASAKKQQFDTVVITILQNADTYLKVTLGKVIVTSVLVDFNLGSGPPREQIALSYRLVSWEYNGHAGGYDLELATD